MHEYYRKNSPKLKKAMNGFLKPIAGELEMKSSKSYTSQRSGSTMRKTCWSIFLISAEMLSAVQRI